VNSIIFLHMKKNLLGAAVLLFATIGAFATAKNTSLATVCYEDSTRGCIQAIAQPCDNLNGECVKPVFDLEDGTTYLGDFQIYASHSANPLICSQPYRQ